MSARMRRRLSERVACGCVDDLDRAERVCRSFREGNDGDLPGSAQVRGLGPPPLPCPGLRACHSVMVARLQTGVRP